MIKEPYFISNHEVDISCCIGISIYMNGNVPVDMLLKYSDIALYEAKRTQGVYRFHELSQSYMHLYEIKTEKELKKAIERDQISLPAEPCEQR